MTTLVIGGAASGKSEYAESLIMRYTQTRYYIATMQMVDEESARRVARHRAMRADKRFQTVECPMSLESVVLPKRGAVLLECVSNLAANELYGPGGTQERALESIVSGIASLERQCDQLVLVSNEVFTGGNQYAGDTDTYLHLLADVNRTLAARADRVCEVICGIPQYYKGKEEIR